MTAPHIIYLPKDIDLKKLVAEVFSMSKPQGMGYMHFTEAPLPDDEIAGIVDREAPDKFIVLHMDYVRGRACKFLVFREKDTGKLCIDTYWYDHTHADLVELGKRCGFEVPPSKEHGWGTAREGPSSSKRAR